MKNKETNSRPARKSSRPTAFYAVLSIDQARALATLAERCVGEGAPDFASVSLSGQIQERKFDHDGAAQLGSFKVDGWDLLAATYAGKFPPAPTHPCANAPTV